MADAFDKQLAHANVYAEALFALARETGKVDEVRHELQELSALMRTDPAFLAFAESKAIDDEVRETLLEKVFRGKISDLTLNTLLVLNANGRHGLIHALLRDYMLHQQEAAREVEVVATTAVELSAAQKKAVTETAAKLSGKEPLMEFRVDAELIGGLVLQIGDLRFDNCIRSQLREARLKLLERSEHGLPVGIGE